MASQPGEENVATLFGDIHYFYGPPTSNPPHHRFDKGSYVYLFENANERRARIEIANQPGTEHQDAFDGFLDKTHVRYSYKQHCVVSLTVGEANDPNYWHLPTYDPRNENKYHYPLHSLDIYFWTKDDALQFVNGIRRVLPPAQVEVLDEPAPPSHRADASAVVQKLENVAISDPSYATGQAAGAPVAPPPQQQQPPISAVPTQQAPATFAPMAYNPAAPAAPETIRHREKTPPPDDGGVDPLAQAVAYDSQAPFSPGFVPPPGFQPGQQPLTSPGLPPPPSALGPSPQPGGLQRSATMPVQSPGIASPQGSAYPGSPGFQPPPPPPGAPQTQAAAAQGSTPPSQGSTPSSFSQYQYNPAQPQQQPQQAGYSVHSQFYQPTEAEAHKYKNNYGRQDQPSGRLEENAGRLERGVTGMFKKFEKKFG